MISHSGAAAAITRSSPFLIHYKLYIASYLRFSTVTVTPKNLLLVAPNCTLPKVMLRQSLILGQDILQNIINNTFNPYKSNNLRM